uniref:LD24753p n=1 Tax=Drosophila melanogaster TaxID=7227 RepID=Q9VSK7_DROME
MTNYENIINLPLNFNANNHAAGNNENNAKIAIVGEQLLNKMSQRDFSESGAPYRRRTSSLAIWRACSCSLCVLFDFDHWQQKRHIMSARSTRLAPPTLGR